MDVIDRKWIANRLTGERGEMARLARHMRIDQMKLTKILKGERRVQPEEIPLVVAFFSGVDNSGEPVASFTLPDPAAGISIPVYDVTASAGHGALLADYEVQSGRLAFPPDYLREITSTPTPHLRIIRTKGDSMVPTIAEDDIVMVDTSKRDLSFDGVFVIRDDGASLLVKRIGRATRRGYVMVISDNPRYAPAERPLADIEVLGKVIWMGVRV